MKSSFHTLPVILFIFVIFPLFLPGENIILNSDFSIDRDNNGIPDGWDVSEGISYPIESGKRLLKIEGGNHFAATKIPLKNSWMQLKLSFKVRYKDVEVGDQDWKTARMAMVFNDKNGKRVGNWPDVWGEIGNSNGWVYFEREYKIPEGADYLLLQPANFGKNGIVEFSEINLTVSKIKKDRYEPDDSDFKKLNSNILNNGDFKEDSNNDDLPDGWTKRDGISYPSENGKRWLMIEGGKKSLQKIIELEPTWRTLKISFKARYKNVIPDKENWQNARMAMNFADDSGNRVGDWPDVFNWSGSSDDWIYCERDYKIPPGATALILNPANFGTSGQVEFSDITVKLTSLNFKGDMPLPETADKNPWDINQAWKLTNFSREKICINGLWRVIPEVKNEEIPPPEGVGWGWFKVPGIWPTTDWTLKESTQKFLFPPMAEDMLNGKNIEQLWYEREIEVPLSWNDRKIYLDFTMLQTHAKIFIDRKYIGEKWFPGGNFDITDSVIPGKKHRLTLLVTARPLEAEKKVFMAPDRVIASKAVVKLKGITGDLFLYSEPKTNSITDVHVITSVSEKKITFKIKVARVIPGNYFLSSEIFDASNKQIKFFKSDKIVFSDENDTYILSDEWKDPLLWDTNAPHNLYSTKITLQNEKGEKIDEFFPVKFGFREFKIDGKNFFLNGKLIRLRALWVNSIADFADKCDFSAGINLCKRMKAYGFNFFITGNYDFAPGDVSYMDSILEAADQSGILLSFSLPHVKNFDWFNNESAVKSYAEITEWLISRVKNHPSIIMYAMNHNANGYHGDQNPLKLDGTYMPERLKSEIEKGKKGSYIERREKSEKAASIAKKIDPTRPVYHHQCGNLGDIYTVNCYLNWAPRQERSEWLEHWSKNGVKPFFFVEWGLPHIASWSSYRGPEFIWRCLAYQSVWDSEFSAAITGEKAYNMTPKKIELIEAEEKNFAIGKPFHWSIFVPTLSSMEENYREITSYYASDNWRSHRAWGVSSILPWDQASLWQRVKETPDKDNPLKYKTLQKPGIVPDFFHSGAQFINDPGDESNFIPSSLGKIFLKNNMEYLGFVGGYPKFTDKSHNFLPGENIAKQLVIINDSRENVKCKYSWKIESTNIEGRGEVELKPGEIKFCPIKFKAPEKKQSLKMIAEFNFEEKWKCSDIFSFNILKLNLANINIDSEVYLFDPKGDTTRLFDESSINYKKIVSYSDFEPDENRILIIGKNALQEKDANHDFSKSDKPLKMIVFEQNEISLSNKLGFRINIYGFRNLFIRSKNHPVLTGIDEDMLRDWRGESTLTPPYLTDLEEFEEHDPQWEWCGFLNTRVWRCGNSGNVASIVIEKPERGNWLPIVDCGFDLQYSPLIEYSEGNKKIIFCQLDVSGRTENDPVALQITKNIVKYLDKVHIEKIRSVYYDGNQEGANLLEALGVKFSKLNNEKITPLNSLVVIGPNSKSSSLKDLVYQGANLLTIGLDEKTISNILPNMLKMEHFTGFSSTMENMTAKELNGISNSELHFRGKFSFDAFTEKDRDSVEMLKILKVGNGTVALVQIAPWNIDYTTKPYQRTTYRRNCFLISRLLANLHATMTTQLLANFARTPSSSILRLVKDWKGVPDKDNIGESAGWMKENFDDSTWEPILVPGMFDLLRKDLNGYDGFFWYRLKFTLPQEFENEDELTLELGGIDDESWTWLNEQFLGELTKTTNPKNYWNAPRTYTFKTEILRKKEKNTLVVKVNDTYMNGGFREQPRIKRKSAPWINSYYLQNPIAEDDPYRYYRW